ncbi:MAG: hypothetical protein WC523_03790 [Patescibacteria group bacterium]
MKAKILLDLDGVIANFCYSFRDFLNKNYNCNFNIDVEPASYDIGDWGCGIENINIDEVVSAWIKQGGFSQIPSYPGTEDFVQSLMSNYDVSIVTARVGDWDQKFSKNVQNKIKQDTSDWLQKRNIPADRLFFIHDKIPFCQENEISIIIEDKLETAIKASKEKVHTILMNREYNQSKSERLRVYRVYDFNEALVQLSKLS